jgi:hypothetical protein
MTELLGLLARLDAANIHYRVSRYRKDAIAVEIAVPGERWEVEFFPDGHLEVEVFRSDGTILDGKALDDLFAKNSDQGI